LKLRLKTVQTRCHLPIVQPEKIRTGDFYDKLQSLNPDLIVTSAYGKILTRRHLSIPNMGVLNVHASLLPKWRGAAPIHWSILNGDIETGVTIMKTDPGMDTGPIVSKRSITVEPRDTMGMLERKLAIIGGELLIETIPGYLSGVHVPVPQDHDAATYAPKVTPQDALIDWNTSAVQIERLIRGFNPAPGAYSFVGGNRIKFHFAEVIDLPETDKKPGSVLGKIHSKGFLMQTGKGILLCLEVQPASKKSMRGDLLFQGRYIDTGTLFTSDQT
jgi:methionyl-tRNA formyltransferase